MMESTNTPRPTPRSLAARPPRPESTGLPAAEAPAPPIREVLSNARPAERPAVRPGGWDRGRYEQALRHSQLSPPVRLLAWTLAHYAARSKGTIPRDDVPGTHRLAKATGLTELSARNSLLVLEREGWVTRQAPRVGQIGPPTMRLTIPAGTHLPRCPRPGPHPGGHDHHAP